MFGFREIVAADFEFSAPVGERPKPVCLVAHELVSGRKIRLFEAELRNCGTPPYPIDNNTLYLAYYASAELSCHEVLNWSLPTNILDLYVEFRNKTNGLPVPCGNNLLGAMVYYGLNAITANEKEEMRGLAIRGGPYTDSERRELLDYCESDVAGLVELYRRMAPEIDINRAVLRGRYMRAAARMESVGIPLDVVTLSRMRENWHSIQAQLIHRIDSGYHVFEGRTFKLQRWADWLAAHGIPWPTLASGQLTLDDDTFREIARLYPAVEPMRELRYVLSQMRLEDIAVGGDGRNRCLLSAFRARTSRNQPSASRFIFGNAVWLRNLIRPLPDWGLAYIDWSQQEFGIAAYLSDDTNMIAAYESGDPYLAFAKQAGVIPSDATRETHSAARELFKACALAVLYGMGDGSLARRIGQSPAHARELLQLHHETFPKFWRYSDAAVERAMLFGSLHTAFGWPIHVGPDTNPRMLRNFPMQANGAEMLRLACCFATEAGVRVCAPIHDALLIEAPLDVLDEAVRVTVESMGKASEIVLNGFRLRTEERVFRHPGRFEDERGREMWNTVSNILAQIDAASNDSSSYNVPAETSNSSGISDTLDALDALDTLDTYGTLRRN